MNPAPATRAVALLRFMASNINGNRELAAQCFAAAKELAEYEAIRASLHGPQSCRSCGRPIGEYAGRGRRRTYCEGCRPSSIREMPEKFGEPEG